MDKEDGKNLLAILGVPVLLGLILVVMLPLGLFYAWAVQKLYGWFVLPLGAPRINLWEVWGLSLIINHYMPSPDTKDGKKLFGKIIGQLLGTLLALLLGYIIKGHIHIG